MKTPMFALLLLGCFLTSCSTSPSTLTNSKTAVRSYNATASVGDFLTISIDSTAQTITYKNYTNSETGTVPYTVNADGTYTITDPNGNLLSAYEVPGFVMMVEAANAGPNKDTQALITAVESVPGIDQHLRRTELQLRAIPDGCRRDGSRHGFDRCSGKCPARWLLADGRVQR